MRFAAAGVVAAGLAAGCGGSGAKLADSGSTTVPSAATTLAEGGSTTSPAAREAPKTSDFCSTISDDEAFVVLGVPITRRDLSPSTGTGSEGCLKGNERQADLAKVAYVSFSTFPPGGDLGTFEQVKASLPDAQVLGGIGDDALFSPSGGLVMGFVGGKVFMIQVVKGGRPATQADFIGLAATFVDRIS